MKRRFAFSMRVFLLLALMLTWGAGAAGASASSPALKNPAPLRYAGCGGPAPTSSNENFEQMLIELVNAERLDHGLPPFGRSPALDEAARYHAADMAQDNYFDHDTYDRENGAVNKVCDWDKRLTYFYDWKSAAENIARGQASPEAVMKSWMNSSGHRANILSNAWEIGLGYYQDSRGAGYWVQDFGQGSGSYPLIINREAASTDSQQVSLYIYGSWKEMRLRNDGGSWSAWQPFQSELDWTLGSGQGTHTVSAEMRSGSSTATASDSIELAPVGPASPTLGGLPPAVFFMYSIPDESLWPAKKTIAPASQGGSFPLEWELSVEGDWFMVTPSKGSTPQEFTILPQGYQGLAPGTYSGRVTVTVMDPAGVSGSPAVIEVEMKVTDLPLTPAYLPLLVH